MEKKEKTEAALFLEPLTLIWLYPCLESSSVPHSGQQQGICLPWMDFVGLAGASVEPGSHFTAKSVITQDMYPRSYTPKKYVHLIIFQPVCLVKFIIFCGNKYLSKYNIGVAFEALHILSNNSSTSSPLKGVEESLQGWAPTPSWGCFPVTGW